MPATTDGLVALHRDGTLGVDGPAYAVTPALRAWVTADDPKVDDEQLELAAASEAARHSLRLLSLHGGAGRRVVVAVDLPTASVTVADGDDTAGPGQVRLAVGSVPAARVAALLVDASTGDVPALVRTAVAVVEAADSGDLAAEHQVAALEDQDLLWYDPAELAP